MRVGLYGGSFNPIHVGHLLIARSVAEQLGLEKVYLIPAAVPPHKPKHNLAGPEHRWQMVCLAAEGEDFLEPSECELRRQGPSYTIDTVKHFAEQIGPEAELHWIVGADSLSELTTWYQIERLLDMCKIITAARPGWEQVDTSGLSRHLGRGQVQRLMDGVLQTPRIEISSSDIRHRVAKGLPIRYLVPSAVEEYIAKHGLYRPD